MNGDVFLTSLSRAARDNPLAAALIGGGALWLLMGSRPLAGMASGIGQAAASAAEIGSRGVAGAAQTVTDIGGNVVSQVAEAARTAASAAQDAGDGLRRQTEGLGTAATSTLDRAVDAMSQAIPEAPDILPRLRDSYDVAQSALADILEQQPLVLGAIGLAIGAGVAYGLKDTRFEKSWAGEAASGLRRDVLEPVASQVQDAAGEIGSNFRAAATETAERLRQAGSEAAKTIRESM